MVSVTSDGMALRDWTALRQGTAVVYSGRDAGRGASWSRYGPRGLIPLRSTNGEEMWQRFERFGCRISARRPLRSSGNGSDEAIGADHSFVEGTMHVLPAYVPWYVIGPAIGLLIVATYALLNRPLGNSGAYGAVVELARDGTVDEPWRLWHFVGLPIGGLAVGLLRGDLRLDLAYGALGAAVPAATLVPVLFVGGVLLGYGARWAGGCTSGHGMCGTAVLSPGSLAATATFFGTAVVVTNALYVVSGGAW